MGWVRGDFVMMKGWWAENQRDGRDAAYDFGEAADA
jgi:hypothetical protein